MMLVQPLHCLVISCYLALHETHICLYEHTQTFHSCPVFITFGPFRHTRCVRSAHCCRHSFSMSQSPVSWTTRLTLCSCSTWSFRVSHIVLSILKINLCDCGAVFLTGWMPLLLLSQQYQSIRVAFLIAVLLVL